jgi:hypothetical protein
MGDNTMTQEEVEKLINDKVEPLAKEVTRLAKKVIDLERKFEIVSRPKNIVAAVQDHALRTPQRR